MGLFSSNNTDESSSDSVWVKVTEVKERSYTEHTAELLNANGGVVKELTFDHFKWKRDNTVLLANYTGLREQPSRRKNKFKRDVYLMFDTRNFALETTGREKKTITEEFTTKETMDRSLAEKKDNVEIVEME